MCVVDLVYAQAHLSELVDCVAAGATIEIARDGKPVARLMAVSMPRKRIDVAILQSLTAPIKPYIENSADLSRSMRDGDRY